MNPTPGQSKGTQRHVFGMAKSGLIPHGGTVRNLELDFLRLVHAIAQAHAAGHEAVGYLCVLNDRMQRAIENWIKRYQTGDAVRVVVAELTEEQSARLDTEKQDNREGNRTGASAKKARADFGRHLAESALRTHIERIEPGVLESPERPLGINWDYYGVVLPKII